MHGVKIVLSDWSELECSLSLCAWVRTMMLQSFNILPLATVMLQSNSIKLMLNSH